ncbi:MAG: metallophosphoesterase [Lentisphaeria bacterium]|nr:metallophosphoesterase [Lentisphaeria bacterium]
MVTQRRGWGSLCRLAVAVFSILFGRAGAEAAPGVYSFVVFGDNQFATDSPTSGVPERMAVPEVILALQPELILHTGDLMDHGRDPEAYDRFVEYYRTMLDAIPFFPTMGNHDAGYEGVRNYGRFLKTQLLERNAAAHGPRYAEEFTLWYDEDTTAYPTRFDDPRVAEFRTVVPSGVCFKTCYAFRFRNAVFVSLEQGTRWWSNTPLPWLEKTLRRAREDASVDHIFVIMHHPMYSSTMLENPPNPAQPAKGECIAPVRVLYEELFQRHDVTIVFSGHAHLYDRFYVPDDGHATHAETPPTTFPHDGKAIHYIVTGGGGGPLNRGGWQTDKSSACFQNRIRAYHVIQVQVDGRKLTLTPYLVSGDAANPAHRAFETFVIGP